MNDTFCIMPWISMAVTPDGRVTPCCAINIAPKFLAKNIDDKVRSSKLWTDMRRSMLEGKKLDDCRTCYLKESHGAMSQRLIHTKDVIRPNTIDPLPLERIEVAFSNLCNLACVGCNDETSSTFGVKNGSFAPYDSHGQTFEGVDMSSVKYLKVLGGEPLMEELKLINLLKRMNLKNLEVEFVTNGTRFLSDDLLKLLNECRMVNVHVSMDGIPSVNEWCRWPVNHELVVSNMKKYSSWGKAYLKISSIINIYNVWSLDKFREYCVDVLPEWKPLFNWVKYPEWQSISLIPAKNRPVFNTEDHVYRVTEQTMKSEPKATLYQFKQNTDFLVKQRGIDVYKIVPQLKQLEI